MKALLIYPKFPQSFWSFEKTLELSGAKVLLPPLGLVTVAALLPQSWQFKLVDCNIRDVTEEEWQWAEIVLLSGMIAQKTDMHEQIREAKRRAKTVIVGGPYATSLPEDFADSGADCLVLDEGELTIPPFLEDLSQGRLQMVYRCADKPDVTQLPVPRFDLLELHAYESIAIQYSRGCPFLCEFCDIITLYGRKPRTKTPQQILNELDSLYKLGWRGAIFMVDDNFIGNKRSVKTMLRTMLQWQVDNSYPYIFITEASIDLATDAELLELMVLCNFKRVFIGIETPDESSLILTRKKQNIRHPLHEMVDTITKAGLQIIGGFIIGFDNEKPGAGQRIVDFVETGAIPIVFFSMLQALPNTALWTRLEKEQRLLFADADINQTTLMNFTPSRPIEEIVSEYLESLTRLYDPQRFLDRVFSEVMKLGTFTQYPAARDLPRPRQHRSGRTIYAMLVLFWRQGMLRKTRWRFWLYLAQVIKQKPSHFAMYLRTCAYGEHLIYYRQVVSEQIMRQITDYHNHRLNETALQDEATAAEVENTVCRTC